MNGLDLLASAALNEIPSSVNKSPSASGGGDALRFLADVVEIASQNGTNGHTNVAQLINACAASDWNEQDTEEFRRARHKSAPNFDIPLKECDPQLWSLILSEHAYNKEPKIVISKRVRRNSDMKQSPPHSRKDAIKAKRCKRTEELILPPSTDSQVPTELCEPLSPSPTPGMITDFPSCEHSYSSPDGPPRPIVHPTSIDDASSSSHIALVILNQQPMQSSPFKSSTPEDTNAQHVLNQLFQLPADDASTNGYVTVLVAPHFKNTDGFQAQLNMPVSSIDPVGLMRAGLDTPASDSSLTQQDTIAQDLRPPIAVNMHRSRMNSASDINFADQPALLSVSESHPMTTAVPQPVAEFGEVSNVLNNIMYNIAKNESFRLSDANTSTFTPTSANRTPVFTSNKDIPEVISNLVSPSQYDNSASTVGLEIVQITPELSTSTSTVGASDHCGVESHPISSHQASSQGEARLSMIREEPMQCDIDLTRSESLNAETTRQCTGNSGASNLLDNGSASSTALEHTALADSTSGLEKPVPVSSQCVVRVISFESAVAEPQKPMTPPNLSPVIFTTVTTQSTPELPVLTKQTVLNSVVKVPTTLSIPPENTSSPRHHLGDKVLTPNNMDAFLKLISSPFNSPTMAQEETMASYLSSLSDNNDLGRTQLPVLSNSQQSDGMLSNGAELEQLAATLPLLQRVHSINFRGESPHNTDDLVNAINEMFSSESLQDELELPLKNSGVPAVIASPIEQTASPVTMPLKAVTNLLTVALSEDPGSSDVESQRSPSVFSTCSVPPSPLSPFDPSMFSPAPVYVKLLWFRFPALMLGVTPYIRLVDICHIALPSMDASLLKSRCQRLHISVHACTDFQRAFIQRYAHAGASRSNLIISADNATRLLADFSSFLKSHGVDPEAMTWSVDQVEVKSPEVVQGDTPVLSLGLRHKKIDFAKIASGGMVRKTYASRRHSAPTSNDSNTPVIKRKRRIASDKRDNDVVLVVPKINLKRKDGCFFNLKKQKAPKPDHSYPGDEGTGKDEHAYSAIEAESLASSEHAYNRRQAKDVPDPVIKPVESVNDELVAAELRDERCPGVDFTALSSDVRTALLKSLYEKYGHVRGAASSPR